MDLQTSSAKRVTFINNINEDRKDDCKFLTGKSQEVMTDLWNIFCHTQLEMSMILNMTKLKNAIVNQLKMIGCIEELEISFHRQSKKLKENKVAYLKLSVCGKVYPGVLTHLSHAAKKANTIVRD